jgi:NAD(P)-dependent dehydrogenase (short-subunit alcohol dehydrogenase family)
VLLLFFSYYQKSSIGSQDCFLDVLVAHAGISKAVAIEDTTAKDFDNLFAVNIRAP